MAVTPSNAAFVSSEVVSTFAFDEFFQEPAMMPELFTQKGSSGFREVSASFSALGDFQQKNELAEPAESDPIQQFSKEFAHLPYALQSKVARETVDDQRFPFFEKFGAKIGQSAIRSIEKLAAKVFINSFDTTFGTAEDGLAICSSAHKNVDGGNSQANKGTTALSLDSVTTTRALMRAYKDYIGNIITVVPDLILISNSANNEENLFEILKSDTRPDTANRAMNYNFQRYEGAVWLYLTDSNDWWMIDRRLMAQNLFWYWRIVLEIYGDGDLFTGRRRIGGYFRSSHGTEDWRWVFGQQVA